MPTPKHDDSRKIISARITPMPRPLPEGMSDPMPEVFVTLEGGEEIKLFQYYADEMSFVREEFIGLTVGAAIALRRRKDVAYLRSVAPAANGAPIAPEPPDAFLLLTGNLAEGFSAPEIHLNEERAIHASAKATVSRGCLAGVLKINDPAELQSEYTRSFAGVNVAAIGDFASGLSVYGPFQDHDTALEFAQTSCRGESTDFIIFVAKTIVS